MESVLATVKINIGLGNNNPTLIIRATDNLPALIDKLIRDYRLPKTVQPIILQAVNQQLAKNKTIKTRQKSPQPTRLTERNRSVSNQGNRSTVNRQDNKSPRPQKQNNRNSENCLNQTAKNINVASRSPGKNWNKGPLASRVELQATKSPLKVSQRTKESKGTKETEVSQRIRKLFRYLTRNNPKNVKILSPEYVDLRGLNKNLLEELQGLFERLEEEELEKMEEDLFLQRVGGLGLTSKLGKKEYENSYRL